MTAAPPCRHFGVAAAFLSLAAVGRADAAEVPVVLLASNDSPALGEVTTRLRAELSAAGWELRQIGRPAGTSTIESTVVQSRAFAAIVLSSVSDGSATVAELWIRDERGGKFTHHRLAMDMAAADAASILAVQAMERMLAALVIIRAAAEAPPVPSPAPSVSAPPTAPAAPETARVFLGSGGPMVQGALAAVRGLPGRPFAYGPMIRVTHRATSGLAARLTIVGPTGGDTSAFAGSADLRQGLALAEVVHVFGHEKGVVAPVLSAGVGAYHLQMKGHASPPYQGMTDTLWAFAADVGAGLAVRLGRHWGLLLDVHALVLQPRPVVTIGQVDATRAGLPSLITSFGVLGGF